MTTLIVDIEKLASKYLREHAAVMALGARIVAKTPADPDSSPWVRVTRLDASQSPQDRSDHLVGFYCQFDCFASKDGGQPEANLLARTIRGALQEIPQVHADGVVSAARINGDARIPDTDFEPARERIVLTATLWAHA